MISVWQRHDDRQGDMMETKDKLSALWLFAILNYLYCDLIGLMDPAHLAQFLAGSVDGIVISQEFLIAAAVLMEIPIAMVLLSRLLDSRMNRYANIAAGAFMTIVQAATLTFGTNTMYYLFFSAFEIAATVSIFWIAWNWKGEQRIRASDLD